MITTKFVGLAVLSAAVMAFALVQAQEHPDHDHSILDAADAAGGFEIFLQAVQAAGVTEQLQSPGPYTVFAPTDEAFARLPDGMLANLLEPANRAQLAGLLANHVVPGRLMAADIKTMAATNINGQDLRIRLIGGVASINGARVVRPDLVADNGVIHGIKAVILTTESVDRAPRGPLDHPAH